MHEHFQLDRRTRTNLGDLGTRKLAREHDALSAELLPGVCRHPIRIVRLRADMERHFGRKLACEREDAEVGDEQAVDMERSKEGKIRRKLFQIRIVREDIERHIDFSAKRMGKTHAFFQLRLAEIAAEGAQTEALAAQIDGVRSVDERHLELFQVARRRQKLRLFQTSVTCTAG